MSDQDTKPELPIHLILGASEYSRIKTNTKPKIGQSGEPIAELTALGWSMMAPERSRILVECTSPGHRFEITNSCAT